MKPPASGYGSTLARALSCGDVLAEADDGNELGALLEQALVPLWVRRLPLLQRFVGDELTAEPAVRVRD